MEDCVLWRDDSVAPPVFESPWLRWQHAFRAFGVNLEDLGTALFFDVVGEVAHGEDLLDALVSVAAANEISLDAAYVMIEDAVFPVLGASAAKRRAWGLSHLRGDSWGALARRIAKYW